MGNTDDIDMQFKSYWKRWLVMANLALINLSIATIWLGFSPIAYKASNYYQTPVVAINWLSIGVLVLSMVFGFLWSWVMNKIGLRACMLICAWVAAAGSVLRICSTVEYLPHILRLVFLFVGQYLVGIVQPLGIYCSPKVAAIWFPSAERSIASTVAGIANPVGIVITGLVSPLFVTDDGSLMTRYMLISYAGLPIALAVVTTIVMTSDEPPTPPSLGGTMTSSDDFIGGVKQVLRNKEFVILMIAVGSGIGLYSSFATLGEQVLCPWGYTDTIVGVCSSVMTGAGLVGAVISSVIVGRTKLFSEALKFMFISASLATILFALTHRIYMGYLISLEMAALGFLAFGISPIGMEAGAEVTFPVGVSIGTAMIQIMGQILSTVLILLLQSIGRPMTVEETLQYGSKCHGSAHQHDVTSNTTNSSGMPLIITYNMTTSTYVIAGFVAIVSIVFVFLFRPTYRRLNAEKLAYDRSAGAREKAKLSEPSSASLED